MVFLLEIIGTIAFAISGAIIAINKKMDILGVAVLGVTTATGGGIIRDLIMGINPPSAFRQPVYALTAIVVSLIVFIPFLRKRIDANNYLLLVMDSIGLGIFTVVGVRACTDHNNLFLSIFVGAITGVGGGVLRDVFTAEPPAIFVKNFYAMASIIGALACSLIWPYSQDLALITGAVIVFTLRMLAARYRWHLPRA